MELELRFFRMELRVTKGEDGERMIAGYAAPFNVLSADLGGFKEIIEPGAFINSLRDDVRALINHDPNLILGRTVNGTLELVEDDVGLRYEISPPDTQYARDLITSLERGDVDGSSFAFRAIEESWRNPTEDEPFPIRVLREVQLFDVSPATFPAYPSTTAQVRDMAKKLLTPDGRATAGATATRGAARRLALRRRRLQLIERL